MPDLPEVIPQFAFVGPSGAEWARADFLVGRRLVVEFDGRTKYKASEGSTTAEIEDVVWREKRREDRIRAHGGGMVVVRLGGTTWTTQNVPGSRSAKGWRRWPTYPSRREGVRVQATSRIPGHSAYRSRERSGLSKPTAPTTTATRGLSPAIWY